MVCTTTGEEKLFLAYYRIVLYSYVHIIIYIMAGIVYRIISKICVIIILSTRVARYNILLAALTLLF